MKTVTYSRILSVAGALTMLYSRWMPVSIGGSSIVNVHLMSERQNTLIIGCVLFIGGIILQAAFKGKDEGGDAPPEVSNNRRSIQADLALRHVNSKAVDFWTALKSSKWGGRAVRFVVGLLMTRLFAEQLVLIFGWLSSDSENLPKETWIQLTYAALGISLLSLAYIFRRKPFFSVLGDLLATYIFVALGMWAYECYTAGEFISLLHDENMALTLSMVALPVIRFAARRKGVAA